MSDEFRGQVERSAVTKTPGKFERKPIGSAVAMKGQPESITLKAETVLRTMSKSKTPSKGQPS